MKLSTLHSKVLACVLGLVLYVPLPSYAAQYCVDLFAFGDFGAMSFDVTTDDDADEATVEIVAGYARGFELTGSWDGDTGIGSGSVSMSEHPLMGYLAFDFEISSVGSSTGIEGTMSFDGTTETIFTGIEGACTSVEAPLEGDYCLKVGQKNISMKIFSETAPIVRGNLASPSGALRSFNASRDSVTGLILEKPTGAQRFSLEFAGGIVTGTFSRGGRTYDTYGIRNPTDTATGCFGIMIYSGGTGNYYYSTPTIVKRYAYAGTGAGSNHPLATDNFLVKVDLKDMREVWRYELGEAEVRGSAVLDRRGNVYFVKEEGREISFPEESEPEGDHSGSILTLVKISNPYRGTPVLEWEYVITVAGETHGMGHLTPAISKRDILFVGGDALHAVNSSGTELWTFVPSDASDPQIYNAPIINEVNEIGKKLVFFNVNDGPLDGDGIYAVNLITGLEEWSYYPGSSTDESEDGYSEEHVAPETYSSAQFNLDRSWIYTALRDRIYCFDLAGNACTTDWEDGCEIPDLSGGIRAAPLVDSNGDIYIGTKDNDDSKLYKIDGACPASPVIWEADTNADVYTTGVLLDSDIVVIGTEPDEEAGILKAYSTTESEATMEGYLNLYADMTWGSLRVHHGRLIGVANVPTTILGAFMFSIDLAGAGYEHDAENATFRGNNASTGR